MKIIDITQELFSSRLFPGDLPPAYERVKTVEKDGCNLTQLRMNVHNGTHMDAPKHFVAGGKAIHELDLALFYGECTVAELAGEISENEIRPVLARCRDKLLLKGELQLSEAAAEAVAGSHVRLLGVEDQSVARDEEPATIHRILLEKEVVALEGLDLTDVEPGEYILAAFPLKLEGSDGAPVRAVLITLR